MYVLIVDASPMANRHEVMVEVDRILADDKLWPDPETWGTSSQAVAGQRAMLDLFGGPAPARTPAPEESPAQ